MVSPISEVMYTPLVSTVISAAASQRIALLSAGFVQFSVGTKGLWYKFGTSTVDATAGTAAEGYVPQDVVLDVPVPSGVTHVAFIQAAATAVGSVTTYV